MNNISTFEEFLFENNNENIKKGKLSKKLRFENVKDDLTQKEGQIGFHEPTQTWWGWSHRAVYGFGIGSKITKGSVGYDKLGNFTAKTLDDAKKMAKNFAEAVS